MSIYCKPLKIFAVVYVGNANQIKDQKTLITTILSAVLTIYSTAIII